MSNTLIDWGRICKCMHLISKTSLICIYYHFDPYILQDDLLLDGEFSKKLHFRNFFFPGISRGHRVFHSYFTQVKITQFSGNGSTFVHTNNNLLTWLLSPVCYVPTLNTHRTFLSRESPTPTEDPLHIVLYAKIVDKNPISSVLLRCHLPAILIQWLLMSEYDKQSYCMEAPYPVSSTNNMFRRDWLLWDSSQLSHISLELLLQAQHPSCKLIPVWESWIISVGITWKTWEINYQRKKWRAKSGSAFL